MSPRDNSHRDNSHRGNGLHATSYTRLIDVDTHLVDGVLEHLRSHEIAAYVAPSDGHRGPYGDTVLPTSPSDSVYVDTARRDVARDLVDRHLTEVRDELAWAGIVAGFDVESTAAVPPWPASEDVHTSGEEAGDAGDDTAAEHGSAGGTWLMPADNTPADNTPADTKIGFEELRARPPDTAEIPEIPDREDHFEPPPPPPLPTIDTISRFAWAAVIGGPILLIIGTVLRLDLAGWPGLLGLGAFVGGFVTLVARMKDRPPADLGGDDGAVV